MSDVMIAPSSPRAILRSRREMPLYLVAMLIGGVIAVSLLALSLMSLGIAGALPPPQISNSLCIDEKLSSMRANPPQDPNLLVVGSSVAWRHFNAPAAIKVVSGLRPYNAGLCGAKITQTAQVTHWLTKRLPSVKRVILMASPFDFVQCTNTDTSAATSTFDVDVADGFVFGGASRAVLYARYFDPLSLAMNARHIRWYRRDVASLDPLVQDRYGDAPSEPTMSRGLFYGSAGALDPSCFVALKQMAQALQTKSIAFAVVLTPTQSEWIKLYGNQDGFEERLKAGVQEALTGSAAKLLAATPPPDDAFYDALHFRWSRTGPYTVALMSSVQPAIANGPLALLR